MPEDTDKVVLAARVLSFLKKSVADGPKPSEAETKAAKAAVTLLSIAFQEEAKNSTKLFEKLKQVARTKSDGGQSDLDQVRLQIYMDRQQKMYETLSNIMKKQSETSGNIAKNFGG